MAGPKRHLASKPTSPVTRAACGLSDPRHWTFDPAEVTCKACAGTLRMAEAELAFRR